MKALPKISIVIPSYNKVEYIQETLESIVSQKYPNLEVIIQDGSSTDGTLEIIKKYAKKYPEIFSWVSRKDKGQVDSINKGLMKAKGDIVTYINADDIYENGALFVVGVYYRENPGILWLAGKGDMINGKGKRIFSLVTKYKNLLLRSNWYLLLLVVNYLNQPAVFLSKNAYKKYGPFSGTKDYVMEYDLWLKLGKIQMPSVLKDHLASFRLTVNSISSTEFKILLSRDFKVVRRYTKNSLILFLHNFHNFGRTVMIHIIKICNPKDEQYIHKAHRSG